MPYSYKPFGQYVQAKPADKLYALQGHVFLYTSMFVVFVAKFYLPVVNALQAVVADGDFVRVTAQVFYHLLWSAKRPFGIHHPIVLIQRVDKLRCHLLRQLLFQCSNEPSPISFAHSFYIKKIPAIALCRFPFTLFCQAPAGYYAMQVRVQGHCLSPGMQYADHTRLRTQPFMVMPKAVQHTPGGLEQQVVHQLRLVHTQLVERIGQCKHYMKIRNRQKLFVSGLYPLLTFRSLAFGTMPVSTAIIADTDVAATAAAIYVAAQCCGAATPYCIEGAPLPGIETAAAVTHLRPMRLQHISHLMCSLHCLGWL